VHVVVDAVTPGVCPSVGFKQVFDYGRGVLTVFESDSVSIDDQRPSRMIWNETVVLEVDLVRLSRSREVQRLLLAGATQTGGALRVPLRSSRVGMMVLR
jgi:hypothetical protein